MKLLVKLLRVEKRAFSRFWSGCFAALAVTALLASCTQDPIFAMISREVKPREPRIKGVPSKMAIFTGKSGQAAVYVGGTFLHRYAKAKDGSGRAVWDETPIPQPPGGIIDLAATQKYLYALTNPDFPALYRWNGKIDEGWDPVSFFHAEFPWLQAIYGETDNKGAPATEYLFVGARRANVGVKDRKDYAVFYIADTTPNSIQEILPGSTGIPGTALLTGAVFDNGRHYFSTGGDGVYQWSSPGALPVNITGEKNVKGIIQIEAGRVLAFCYNGEILSVSPSSFTTLNANGPGQYFRGPAAVWRNSDGNPTLLLAAVITPDSTYGPTYGYREINLGSGPVVTGVAGEIALREPGTPTTGYPSTMDDNNRYRDTIAPKPLNSIFQVPVSIDPEGTLFASVQGTGTMKDDTDGGLWSYRIRDGGWQWNAE
jgi:hypothetical protein